ncbi:flagellar hook-associated protein FlgK [Pseudoneobacillus sp. C159]
MASTFHGLEVSRRGLVAQQMALNTTGHNIANANTTGYTRQRVETQASKPISVNGLQLGTGVEIAKIVRLREDYLDVQIRGENKNTGYWEAKSDTFLKIEELLNEPSDTGLANSLDQFWAGWQELANHPESASARAVVLQRGLAVSDTFKNIMASLNNIEMDIKNVIETKTKEINSIAKQIAEVNDQIARLVPNNYQPNDLYDQRDVLIDQLSKLTSVKVTQSTNGMVDVLVGTEKLVSGKNTNELTIDFDPTTGLVDPSKIKIGGNTVTLEGGELLGQIESFGTTTGGAELILPNIKKQINQLATGFMNEVNKIHLSGMNLNNIDGTSNQKYNFFVGNDATDINVHPEIIKSLNWIAAAKEESPGNSSSGNGKNAQVIADIQFGTINFNGSDSTISDFYRNIIGKLAIDSQQSQRNLENSELIVKQIEVRRQSVSGVSLDEEMTNMIKFQQAYNAAARVITAMDQCLDKVINGMGRVGL